jgi:hypothetical protein
MWEVSGTDEFAEWFGQLDEDEQAAVEQRIDLLADQGPALKPSREAILLLGGDKSAGSQWNAWYVTAIPSGVALRELSA